MRAISRRRNGIAGVRFCAYCDADLSSGSRPSRRYCDHVCRELAYRTRKTIGMKSRRPSGVPLLLISQSLPRVVRARQASEFSGKRSGVGRKLSSERLRRSAA